MKKTFVVIQPTKTSMLCHFRASEEGCRNVQLRYDSSYTIHLSDLNEAEFQAWVRYESFGQQDPNDLKNAERVCRNLQALAGANLNA